MQDVVLSAASRKTKGKVFRAKSDQVPGVVYGKTQDPVSISMPANVLHKAYYQVGGNKVVDLTIDEAKEPIKVLFKEVTTDPVTGNLAHFDLYAVTLGEKMRTNVPLHFVGEQPELAQHGEAILFTIRDVVEVEANPLDLPESITVDISILKEIGDTITVGDLKVTGDAEIITDAEGVVVKLDPPKEEEPEEEEPIEAEDGEEAEAESSEDGDGKASDLKESKDE